MKVCTMNMRERMLAVINGGELDRVPFVSYDNPWAPKEEVWPMIGQDNLGILKWMMPYKKHHPNCKIETKTIYRDGGEAYETIITTPKGSLREVKVPVPKMFCLSIEEHFIKKPQDYEILCHWLQDCVVEEDYARLDQTREYLGDNGVPFIRLDRTPFQQLWIEWVKLEDLTLHMFDHADILENVISQLIRVERDIFDVVEKADVDLVNFPDNITAPLIGERYFRQYCLPLYKEMSERLADRNIPVFVHMDGDLKPLWNAIGESGVKGLDSFSPPPDNDTSAADAISMWPEMRLFLNFPSSIHLEDEDTIYNKAMEILEQAGHTGRLQIQISENVPPGMWKKSYPVIVRAIHDFGKPNCNI